jgi:hypothetical protein
MQKHNKYFTLKNDNPRGKPSELGWDAPSWKELWVLYLKTDKEKIKRDWDIRGYSFWIFKDPLLHFKIIGDSSSTKITLE